MAVWKSKHTKWKSEQLSDFCRQVGAMCGAGIPLANAMEIMKGGAEKRKQKQLYEEIQLQMGQGAAFSKAMEITGVFPELLLYMFRAAEATGNLEETAKRMAVYYRKEHRTKNQIRSATLYPKILGIVSIIVVLTIFLMVIPTVEPMFKGAQLPVLTRFLMACSRGIINGWYLLPAFVCIGSIMTLFLKKNRKVQRMIDRMKVHIPLIGKQCRIIYTARFARSESSLYSSGLPMVEGLTIAAATIGNRYLEDQFKDVIKHIQGGHSLSRAIESIDGFDKKLAPVIFVGEETGKLDEMLENIADSYEQEAEAALNRLVSMIEPAMIIGMGIAVGIILLGIMMPMWSMYEYMM